MEAGNQQKILYYRRIADGRAKISKPCRKIKIFNGAEKKALHTCVPGNRQLNIEEQKAIHGKKDIALIAVRKIQHIASPPGFFTAVFSIHRFLAKAI